MNAPFAAALAFCCLATAPSFAEEGAASRIRLVSDSPRGLWGLSLTEAPLSAVTKLLARRLHCRITLDPSLEAARVTGELSPRAPERLLVLLGRRANVAVQVLYRFDRSAPEPGLAAPPGFGQELLASDLRDPMTPEIALRTLGLPFELGPGLEKPVRLRAFKVRRRNVLDQIATQTGSTWSVEVRIRSREAIDALAAQEEAQRFHYSDLAVLTTSERREEIREDLRRLEALPEEERAINVQAVADSLIAMATMLKRFPQENRPNVAANIHGIGQDYDAELRRLPVDGREWAQPLFDALRELTLQLREIH